MAAPHSLKADLARTIADAIRERGLTQAEAAGIVGARQPDISAITRGKLDRFSLDRLVRFALALGLEVGLRVSPGFRGNAPRSPSVDLPEHLRRYFQEYGTRSLRLPEHRETIVIKLLEEGGMDAVIWLRAEVGDDALRETIRRREGRGMSPRRLRFWALLLDLPKEEVDPWVEAARGSIWGRRTG